MRVIFFFILITVKIIRPAIGQEMNFSKKSTSSKYPYGLITPGYGIVTEDDLAYDNLNRKILPYSPYESSTSLYWQCFPVKNVTPKYRTWRDNDAMGVWNITTTLCDLEIIVCHEKKLQIYGDRRAHPVELCQNFITEWQNLTRDEDIVCLSGTGGSYSKHNMYEKYKYWTWEKFKTKKGCLSYFIGQCNTLGCSKGKCPQ